MHRCIELAKLGAGNVAPNPMVGAILVYEDRIIGEGYHQKYGEAHAEVHCIGQAAQSGQADIISKSTLYVSLEPCAHFGKTPPCADLIIKHKIPKVVIGCRDPFKEVNGKGIEKLRAAGIEVELGVLEEECKELNKRFFTFHTEARPYIILKWAETGDGFIATSPQTPLQGRGALTSSGQKEVFNLSESKTPVIASEAKQQEGLGEASPLGGGGAGTRLLISNQYTNRLVHKWRSEEAAILVGTNTVEYDNPELTTRLWPGHSPMRLIVDMQLRLSSSLRVFNQQARTVIFNAVRQEEKGNLLYYQVTEDVSIVHQIANALYQLKIQSVIVEGGARLLQSFIDERMWDEARVISNGQMAIGKGLPAPVLNHSTNSTEINIFSDKIEFYQHAR